MSENLPMSEEAFRIIAHNLQQLEARISAACARAGRKRAEVTLVAVSKTRTLAEIRAAYACGLRHFGENLIEEAEEGRRVDPPQAGGDARIFAYHGQCIDQGRFSQGFPALDQRRDRIGAFGNLGKRLKDVADLSESIGIRHYRPFRRNHKGAIDQYHRKIASFNPDVRIESFTFIPGDLP